MISMKKTALGLALGMACGVSAVSAQAAMLNAGDVLTINAGVDQTTTTVTASGASVTTTVSLCGGSAVATNGSCFGMQSAGVFGFTSITGKNGIVIGTAQAASGSHVGIPKGTESSNIDQAWAFFGNTGMHQTTVPVTSLTSTATGGTLNFSGWNVTWNGIAGINMGAGGLAQIGAQAANGANNGGSASFAWDGVYGHQYQLWYNATVPLGDPSNFGGVNYRLHLVGTVMAPPSTIPVPAAVWLLGSGLLGLVGVARRKKSA